jgi:hypothetical protein
MQREIELKGTFKIESKPKKKTGKEMLHENIQT